MVIAVNEPCLEYMLKNLASIFRILTVFLIEIIYYNVFFFYNNIFFVVKQFSKNY